MKSFEIKINCENYDDDNNNDNDASKTQQSNDEI